VLNIVVVLPSAPFITHHTLPAATPAHDEHDELPAYEYESPIAQNAQVAMVMAPVTFEYVLSGH
jgi:hypothetical protein